jgi:hypothetical protein
MQIFQGLADSVGSKSISGSGIRIFGIYLLASMPPNPTGIDVINEQIDYILANRKRISFYIEWC